MRQPGVEPGSAAWKATMLTVTPLTLDELNKGDSCNGRNLVALMSGKI